MIYIYNVSDFYVNEKLSFCFTLLHYKQFSFISGYFLSEVLQLKKKKKNLSVVVFKDINTGWVSISADAEGFSMSIAKYQIGKRSILSFLFTTKTHTVRIHTLLFI